MSNQWIFPTSCYGQLSDVYGTAVAQYNTPPNTSGFPVGSGLNLGQRGILQDFTETTLCNVGTGGAAQYDAMTYTIGNSNMYSAVVKTGTVNVQPVVAINDRAGATALVANNVAWMTTRGLAQALVLTGVTAPAFLVSSATAGTLTAATPGTSSQSNIYLLNTTTSTTNWPVQIV